MVKLQFCKLSTKVRFPLSAPLPKKNQAPLDFSPASSIVGCKQGRSAKKLCKQTHPWRNGSAAAF